MFIVVFDQSASLAKMAGNLLSQRIGSKLGEFFGFMTKRFYRDNSRLYLGSIM